MKSVELQKFRYREQDCIGIFFPNDDQVTNHVRMIPTATYLATHGCWYIPEQAGAVAIIIGHLRGKVWVDISKFKGQAKIIDKDKKEDVHTTFLPKSPTVSPTENESILKLMEQKLKLRGYSSCTLKTYVSQFKLFLQFHRNCHPLVLQENDIRDYLLYLIDKRKLSIQTQNQAINAIKFYYEKVLNQERKTYYLERPMKEWKLPQVLSQHEVSAIFEATDNFKHKLMLMIIFCGGLRRSELLNLRVGDIDLEKYGVFVRGGKGRKDRITLFAKSLTDSFKEYLQTYKPVYWLFEGAGGRRYSASSLQKVFCTSLRKTGIRKEVSLHTLRHSFATQLTETGTSLRYIQVLLGHESSRTTEIYAHITHVGLDKIRSPLDQMNFPKKSEDK